MLSSSSIAKLQKNRNKEYAELLKLFQAVSDPVRFGILELLEDHATLCVTEIARVFKISVPAASHQLKILETSGLVKRDRMGQMKCYVIAKDDTRVKSIVQLMAKGRNGEKKK